MKTFRPHFETLPPEQRKLWSELRNVPPDFVLYGGTALALRLGHGTSVDFAFFSSTTFHVADLEQRLPFLEQVEVAQRNDNTLTFTIHRDKPVKISFFGGLTFGRVGEPEYTEDRVLAVASLLDIAGTKASVVQMRAEAKDYRDVVALLDSGISLSQMLGAGQALYGEQFNPLISIKALSYFGDGDLADLSSAEKSRLMRAVAEMREIVALERTAAHLCSK